MLPFRRCSAPSSASNEMCKTGFHPDALLCDVPLFRAVFVRGTVHPPRYTMADLDYYTTQNTTPS